jgi:hypothetical protein
MLETKHDTRRRRDRSCLSRRRDHSNNGYNPNKLTWVRVPVKMLSVARKQRKIEERRRIVVVVCGFRGASASKAICAYLQLEGNKILECMHYLQANYKVRQLSTGKINSNI